MTLWVLYFLVVKSSAATKWRERGWLVLALFFSYMAVDDGAQVHERWSRSIRYRLEKLDIGLDAFPSYSWQLIFLPMFVALGIFTFAFLWRELATKRNRALLVIAFGCLALAVGIDFIEGLEDDHPWNVYTMAASSPALESWSQARFQEDAFETSLHFSKSIEETIEMFAHSLLWFLMIAHVGVVANDVRIRLGARTGDAEQAAGESAKAA